MLVDDAQSLTEGARSWARSPRCSGTLDYPRAAQPFAAAAVEDDNGQFEVKEVDMNALVRRTAEDMEEIRLPQHAFSRLRNRAAYSPGESVAAAGRERGLPISKTLVHGDERAAK